ncbi:amyloid-beta A4 precursor protein-binding family A member 2-like isoform X9 [Euwallacea fornicatus]|uniref:amyloid-beta A4 precursor protein-binding family A member 2-like isoform X9 n=1 Tax=Euwallacea fornicatus TaxID=995702 RepID=UPI00338FB052
MTSLTLPLDNIDVSENTEQISKLFPKCRPRSDINLNPILASSKEYDCIDNTSTSTCTVMNAHDENDRWIADSSCKISRDNNSPRYSPDDDCISEHKSSSGTYKLRDSRIIEIAGGRELYSQSRTKAVRKSRSSQYLGEDGEKKTQRLSMKQQGVWELRGKNNEAKKVANPREYTETVFSSEVRLMTHGQESQSSSDQQPSPTNMPYSEDVVVFDDIGDNWNSDNEKQHEHLKSDQSDFTATHTYDSNSIDNDKVTKVIGNLPIAVYEGSPKRYGPRQTGTNNSHMQLPSAQSLLASPSVYPPRPGFPQRIVTSPSPSEREHNIENNSYNDNDFQEHENNFLDLSIGTGSSGDLGETEVGLQVGHSRNFTLSPETTDCDSNCGDLDSEVSLMLMENDLAPSGGLLGSNTDLTVPGDTLRLYSSMPVLEDGLSSGHASDTDNNNPTVMLMKRQITEIEREINQGVGKVKPSTKPSENGVSPQSESIPKSPTDISNCVNSFDEPLTLSQTDSIEKTPPPPAPAPHRMIAGAEKTNDVEAAIKDIRLTLQRTKTLPLQRHPGEECEENGTSPVWVPSHFRQRGLSTTSADSERKGVNSGPDDEENDTDLETDRLLGQQRTDDQGFYDEKDWRKPKSRTIMPQIGHANPKQLLSSLDESSIPLVPSSDIQNSPPPSPSAASDKSQSPQSQKGSVSSNKTKKDKDKKKGRSKEDALQRSVLIEGVLFRARYLGSTQLVCEGQPTKTTRMMQAEEAVSRIKAPDGETQPSTEVDLFISTEKIMVLNTDLKEIMMDHALRTISYIADIGDLVVLMARRRFIPHEVDDAPKINRTPKMICHVFESEEAQFIAQSIGQAFQVAYMEFLKANGIEDHSFVKEMDYQEVLNSQEIFGDELQMFAKKEMQKEVVVPKAKGEILGVVIVESGWGSMLPTVVIANLAPAGAAARCGQLNIGDQIIAINGVSLVGLPLSTCQNYIKNSKNQTVVKLTVVPCAPVVEVKIKRPDTKYQLGFSVQNGVICSLLRGGIAERGGVRVGHRIIEINNQSVVAVPHEKIVNLLATSVGEILMKTMPTSMFRLLTGQENPVYI